MTDNRCNVGEEDEIGGKSNYFYFFQGSFPVVKGNYTR